MIYTIIYFIIGLLVCRYYWYKDYEEEYNFLKENGECEDPMVILLMMFIIVLWPIKLIIEFIYFINYILKQSKI